MHWGFAAQSQIENPQFQIPKLDPQPRSAAGREDPRSEAGGVIGGRRRLGTSGRLPPARCCCDPSRVALQTGCAAPAAAQGRSNSRGRALKSKRGSAAGLPAPEPVALHRTARRPGRQQHHTPNALSNLQPPHVRTKSLRVRWALWLSWPGLAGLARRRNAGLKTETNRVSLAAKCSGAV